MNYNWTLPDDAEITVPDAERIAELAQAKIDHDWELMGLWPIDSRPKTTTGLVYAVFKAMKEVTDGR